MYKSTRGWSDVSGIYTSPENTTHWNKVDVMLSQTFFFMQIQNTVTDHFKRIV